MDPPKLASHLNPAHVPLLEQKTLTARRFLLRATKICELGEGREWPRGLPPRRTLFCSVYDRHFTSGRRERPDDEDHPESGDG